MIVLHTLPVGHVEPLHGSSETTTTTGLDSETPVACRSFKNTRPIGWASLKVNMYQGESAVGTHFSMGASFRLMRTSSLFRFSCTRSFTHPLKLKMRAGSLEKKSSSYVLSPEFNHVNTAHLLFFSVF